MTTSTAAQSPLRTPLSGFASLLLVACVGVACGGGGGSAVGAPAPSTDDTEGNATGAAGAGGEGSVTDTTDVVVVKVQPQRALDVAKTPLEALSLPEPSRLPAAAALAVASLQGSELSEELPHAEVKADGKELTFQAAYDAAEGGDVGIAYAMFDLSVAALGPDAAQSLALRWSGEPPPSGAYWVGLANLDEDRWDFFDGPEDEVLTLESLSAYTGKDDGLRLVIVLAEDATRTLSAVALGAPELRGTGLVPTPSVASPGEQELTSDAPLPKSVSLRASMPYVGNQGGIGSCSGFAVAGAWNYELNRIYAAYGWDDTRAINQVSPKWLYNLTPFVDGECPKGGHSLSSVIKLLKETGSASEEQVPYGSRNRDKYSCETEFSSQVRSDAALLRPDATHLFSLRGDSGVLKAKEVLAAGNAVIIGIHTDSNFKKYESGVWSFGGTGDEDGGHAVVLAGYDDDKEAFYVRNSWGYDWGDRGYFWMSYQSVRDGKLTNRLGDAHYLSGSFSLPAAQRFVAAVPPIQAPANVLATDGEFVDKVVVTWKRDRSAAGYKVYRDDETQVVATIEGGASTQWEDAPSDLNRHRYWVTAFATTPGGTVETARGAPDDGFRATDPLVKGVSPTSGAAGSIVTLSVDVVGTGPFTYVWDFGGGANPPTSTDAKPSVVLQGAGVHPASVTVTGPKSGRRYAFDLVVDYPESVYRHTWGGDAGVDVSKAVFVDATGATFSAGSTQGFGAGGEDLLLTKYDGGGNLLYAKTFGRSGMERGAAIVSDSAGNAYFAGDTDSSVLDMVFGKLDASGAVQFTRMLGGASVDRAMGMAVDARDNVYLTGTTMSAGQGLADAYLARLNPDGSLAWQRTWGTTGADSGESVVVSPDGNFVYVGATVETADRKTDLVLLGFTSSGGLNFARRFSTVSSERDVHVAMGADANVYVSCTSGASKTPNTLLVSYDFLGRLRFQRAVSGTAFDATANHGLAVDPLNNVFLLSDNADVNDSGSYKHLLYKVDTNGNFGWARETAGSVNQSKLLAMAMSPLGKVAFAGSAIGANDYPWTTTQAYVASSPAGVVETAIVGTLGTPAFVPRAADGTWGSPTGTVDSASAGDEDALCYTYNPYE
jgi:C1A family cysteine protease